MKTYNDFINEGIRDKMTPKPAEDVRRKMKHMLSGLQGDILDKLSVIDRKKLFPYLDDETLSKFTNEVLADKKIMDHQFTYEFEKFITFVSKEGNSRYIINLQNNKIYHVGLYAANEVIGALKQLL